jgi:hypothetical protein
MVRAHFPVVELRRYAVGPGEAPAFARCFESFFPEAFQQLGAIIFGDFVERASDTFTWLRGYPDMAARAAVCAAFYDGPLWKEHAAATNARLLDHTNVLLLRPLRGSEQGVPVLPAVDPIREAAGARGVALAQIFTVAEGRLDDFARGAEEAFARYREAGIREVGVLATLDLPNNFPRHPVRTDGPHLVWLGLVEHEEALKTRVIPLAETLLAGLHATGLLRRLPEAIVLDPGPRSRLRWL